MGEDFVSVFSTPSWVEGEIAKGRLEAEGIPVDLKGPSEGHTRRARPSWPFHLRSRRRPAASEQIESGSEDAPD
jgi:hypothetical protein